MSRGTYVWDAKTQTIVPKEELARRQAERAKTAKPVKFRLPKTSRLKSGRWVWDGKTWVPAWRFYAGQEPKPLAPMVIGDIEPVRMPGTDEVISGRRQRREYCRANGLEFVGDDRLPERRTYEPKKAGQDVKDAIDQLDAGRPVPQIGTAPGKGWTDF